MKATACIDWLTFTVRSGRTPREVIEKILCMDFDMFQSKGYGLFGYQSAVEFGNILVMYDYNGNLSTDMGICVSMSGKGCRTFEQHTKRSSGGQTPFIGLISDLHADEFANFSRVDLALDDTVGLLDLDKIVEKVDANEINSFITSRNVIRGYNGKSRSGTTVYIGSAKSDFRIRFYDKAKEKYKKGMPEYDMHWVRTEIVMKHHNANGFAAALANTEDLGGLAAMILNDKIAFIEPGCDSNISRCVICDWWQDFIDCIESVKLVVKEDAKHNVLDIMDWVTHQIAPSLSLIVDAVGYDALSKILRRGRDKRTPKQQALIDDYRNCYRINIASAQS